MNKCGFKKAPYSEFHQCMNEQIPPPTTDGTDYYSKTNGEIRAQLDMYAQQIKKKKLKEKDAYADFTTFVSNKVIAEQKSAEVAGTIIAVSLAGAAVAACANNGCGSPYGNSYRQSYQGCCSWHQGINSCVSGRLLCNDGTFSPTCTC